MFTIGFNSLTYFREYLSDAFLYFKWQHINSLSSMSKCNLYPLRLWWLLRMINEDWRDINCVRFILPTVQFSVFKNPPPKSTPWALVFLWNQRQCWFHENLPMPQVQFNWLMQMRQCLFVLFICIYSLRDAGIDYSWPLWPWLQEQVCNEDEWINYFFLAIAPNVTYRFTRVG